MQRPTRQKITFRLSLTAKKLVWSAGHLFHTPSERLDHQTLASRHNIVLARREAHKKSDICRLTLDICLVRKTIVHFD